MITLTETNRRAVLLAPLATFLLAAFGLAQSSVRGWDQFYWDTESRQGSILSVSASGDHTAIVRSDGRMFVQGQNGGRVCTPPLSVASASFTKVIPTFYAGVGLRSDGNIKVWGTNVASSANIPPAPALPPRR